jgi:hypothetical protein
VLLFAIQHGRRLVSRYHTAEPGSVDVLTEEEIKELDWMPRAVTNLHPVDKSKKENGGASRLLAAIRGAPPP